MSSIQAAIASSHGPRSSSVSAMPACILSMLASGWNQSASANSQCSRAASNAPTVDLPLPETPITTSTQGKALIRSPPGR
jgi:hypothetical protein